MPSETCSPTAGSTSSTGPWAPCSTPAGVFVNVCYDELNVRQPDLVRQIHREYVAAGRRDPRDQHLRGQPPQAGPLRAGRRDGAAQRGRGAARAAAAGGRAAVVGAIGPLSVRLEPFGELGRDEARGGLRPPGRRAPGRRGGRLRAGDLRGRRGAASRLRGRPGPLRSADRGPDDDRDRRPDRLRLAARRLRAAARGDGRRRHRHQLLRRARPARSRRSSSWPRSTNAILLGAAQRRPAPRGRQPQDLHGLARVLRRATPGASSRRAPASWAAAAAPRPTTSAETVRFVRSIEPHRAVHAVAAREEPEGVDPGPARRALAAGRQAGRGRVRHHRRDRAAPGHRSGRHAGPGPRPFRRPASTRSTCPTARGPRAGWARCSRACSSSARSASRRSSTTPAATGTSWGCSRTCSAPPPAASATCWW